MTDGGAAEARMPLDPSGRQVEGHGGFDSPPPPPFTPPRGTTAEDLVRARYVAYEWERYLTERERADVRAECEWVIRELRREGARSVPRPFGNV